MGDCGSDLHRHDSLSGAHYTLECRATVAPLVGLRFPQFTAAVMERQHLPNLGEAWPADGLEQLGSCPLCGVGERTLLHSDLQDRIFFAAPGTWTMWQCSG